MKVYLVDGTYELFRAYFAMPKSVGPAGQPTGAVRGLIQTLLALLRQDDVTHVACAFDSVITSFRNDLFRRIQDWRRHAGCLENAVRISRASRRSTWHSGLADGGIRGR